MRDLPLFAAYIMASRSRNLYVGMTGHLRRRVLEHKCKLHLGFTSRYHCDRLVWFENFEYVDNAIAMEKKLKGWLRARKVALIETKNPTWEDLSANWYTDEQLENFGTDKQILPAWPTPNISPGSKRASPFGMNGERRIQISKST